MEGHDHVAAVVFAASDADVSNNANDTPAGYKDAKAVFPDLFEFVMELLIIFDGAKLVLVVRVFLQGPVRR
jgi:hypothetical protein